VEGVRRAGRDDLPLVAALVAAARAERRGERGEAVAARLHPPHHIEASALDDVDRCVLIGTYDEVVFGVAYLATVTTLDGGTFAELLELYVEPQARGVGVGDALMHAALAWARERGCDGIDASVLPGDREGKNFFERFGLVARAILVHRSLVDGVDPA
jgi:GNAT superfamily N-acetyltransferase